MTAGFVKPIGCRTFRHSFATQMKGGYDIRNPKFKLGDGPYFGCCPRNPFIRKIGALDATKSDAMEIVWQIRPHYAEPDTARLAWDPNTTFHFREEWGPDGAGNSVLRLYRDGILLITMSVPGSWNPVGHSVRIGASPRRDPTAGAPVGAVFSNLKVWDLPSRAERRPLNGKSLHAAAGLFLGLGVSEMSHSK